MKKSKKLLALLLTAVSAFAAGTMVACSKEEENSSESVTLVDNRTVSLNVTEATIVRGGYYQLEAVLSLGEGNFTWTSSDASVATVDKNGKVYGVKKGTAVITVDCDGKQATCTINVVLPDYLPNFQNRNQDMIIGIGTTYPIDGTVTFNGEVVDDATVTYTSANPAVATVDNSGNVTGVAAGITEITVRADYFGAVTEMTVPVKVSNTKVSMQVSSASLQLSTRNDAVKGYSKTLPLGLSVSYDGADISDDLTYAWSVTGATGIVSLGTSTSNVVDVTAAAVGATQVTVSFDYEGETFTYTYNVDVSLAKYEMANAIAEDFAGDIRLTLPGLTETATPAKVFLGEQELSATAVSGEYITLSDVDVTYGKQAIRVEYDDYCLEIADGMVCTQSLTSTHRAEFANILNAKPDGYYALSEDLDFEGVKNDKLIYEFTGTLDGQGHTIKNLIVDNSRVNSAKDNYPCFWMEKNKGTIKNVAIEYTLEKATSWYVGLIGQNEGTVENVFVKAICKAGRGSGAVGPVAGENWGSIHNVIILMEKAGDIQTGAIANVIGVDRGGTVSNVYTVHNGLVVGDYLNKTFVEQYPTGSHTDWAAFENFTQLAAQITALPSEAGWSSAWSIHESGMPMYNGKALGDMTLAPVTVELANGGYTVDLSAVTADILSVTLNGEDVTSKLGGKVLTFAKTELAGGEHALIVKTDGVNYVMTLTCNAVVETLTAQTQMATGGNVVIPLSGITGNVAQILIGDKDVTEYYADGTLSVPVSEMVFGDQTLKVVTDGVIDYEMALTSYSGVINQTNAGTAANFKALLKANPNGYFLLESDLDLGGGNLVGAIDFTGMIDGQGHIIKNFNINYNAGNDNGYNSYLFNSNSGTIRNVGFVYSMTAFNNNKGALILTNTGTIENVFVDCTVTDSAKNIYYQVGALTHTNQGTIKNVIVNAKLANGATVMESGGVKTMGVVTSYNSGAGVMQNVYAINGDGLNALMYAWASQTNVKVYGTGADMAAEVTTFAKADGWNESLWTVENGAVKFGGKYVSEIVIAPSTFVFEGGNYTLDLSAVNEDILSVSLNGVDVTANLSGKSLTIAKADVTSGDYTVIITTAAGSYQTKATCTATVVDLGTQSVEAESGISVIDLSAVQGTVVKVMIGSLDCTEYYASGSVTVDTDTLGEGTYEITVITDTTTDYTGSVTISIPVVNITLDTTNAGTLADFIATINATPNANFTLASDLDFGGAEATKLIAEFSGTLDGAGHSIKNFSLKYGFGKNEEDKDSYISTLFLKNTGTIKNLGIDYTVAYANDTTTAVIHTNSGTVSNVFVNATFVKTSWNSAPLVGINKGTIENTIVIINQAETWSGNSARLGALIGTDHNSTIKNCYSVHNGLVGTDNLATPYIKAATWNNATVTNYVAYQTMDDLTAAVTELAAASGWSTVWSIEDGEICFGGNPLVEESEPEPEPDPEPVEPTLEAVPEDAIWLTTANVTSAADLKALLVANPDAYFALGGNLDLGGGNLVGAIDFTGTLDGRGYKISNFNINYNAGSDNGYNSYLFNSNSGTIKNIGFVYSMTALNNNKGALILTNTGTIENVYVDCTLATSTTGAYYQVGAITHTNKGTIKNAVVKLDVADGVTVAAGQDSTYTVGVITAYNSGTGVIENVYAIDPDSLGYAMFPWATQTNVTKYASMTELNAAVTELSETAGWEDGVWAVVDGAVVFANRVPDTIPESKPELEELPEGAIILSTANVTSAAELKALLVANPDAYFALGENLDLGGGNLVGAIDFTGTLDGRGYKISNFNINFNVGSDNGYNSYLFNSNSGTIKNIGFVYSMTALNNNKGALILTNTGTIENVYVDCTLATSTTGAYYQVGAITHTNKGTIKNAVVKLDVADGVTVAAGQDSTYTVGVITAYNSGTGVIENVYAIDPDSLGYAMFPWATQTNVTKYASVNAMNAAVTELPEESGWNEALWTVESDKVCFNGTAIA